MMLPVLSNPHYRRPGAPDTFQARAVLCHVGWVADLDDFARVAHAAVDAA